MLISLIPEIEYDDHIITIPALIPAMIGNHLIRVVDMVDIRVLTPQAASRVIPVAPQMNKVAIDLEDAREGSGIGPIERLARIEIAPRQKFLPHEEHGNAWRGQDYRRSQSRALLREPARSISGRDHFGDALSAIRIGIVGFGKDHALEGVIIIRLTDNLADRVHIACAIVRANNGGPDRRNEASAPLRVETGPSYSNIFSDPLVVFQVFSNRDFPRLPLCDQSIDLL